MNQYVVFMAKVGLINEIKCFDTHIKCFDIVEKYKFVLQLYIIVD